MSYKPCAKNVSILFFTISDMAAIEPMYQYSLAWFVVLFQDTINAAEKFPSVPRRIEALIRHFTYSLYRNVGRCTEAETNPAEFQSISLSCADILIALSV